VAERVPASRKLQRDSAVALLEAVHTAHMAKGRKLLAFSGAERLSEPAVKAMLGRTGNMRAPTIRVGDTLLVGFNQDIFEKVFG